MDSRSDKRQYRASDPDVLMIIAGDLKTTHEEVKALCRELGNAVYLDPAAQDRLGYTCGDVLGWRSIQRRNIALLEAIRSGAGVVLSIDDDNAPRNARGDPDYFGLLRLAFGGPSGHVVMSLDGWFNVGDLAEDAYYYRGLPFSLRQGVALGWDWEDRRVQPQTRRVGVVNGLIYGDPDINAIDRYPGGGPRVEKYHLVDGLYVNPRTTWTPINSQNTAYVRELAPLAFVLPGVGRYDDIWASFMALRVMEATDYHVYFGEPSVVQERNPHNWLVDLGKELYGMQHTEAFCTGLKAVPVHPSASVLDNLAAVADGAALLPPQARAFMTAYLEDVARVV
jgi:hypothetical protein